MRAEDGRAGTSAAGFPSPRRPADASEDPSDPRARGSRGATVASVALAGCVALAGVVTLASRAGVLPNLIPPRAGALASPSVHSPTASPDLDIPEVFVITGRDADGPTGEWRRVDAATKAQMEAEALKAEHPERKSRTSESTKSEFETSEPGAVEPDVDNPDAVASLADTSTTRLPRWTLRRPRRLRKSPTIPARTNGARLRRETAFPPRASWSTPRRRRRDANSRRSNRNNRDSPRSKPRNARGSSNSDARRAPRAVSRAAVMCSRVSRRRATPRRR